MLMGHGAPRRGASCTRLPSGNHGDATFGDRCDLAAIATIQSLVAQKVQAKHLFSWLLSLSRKRHGKKLIVGQHGFRLTSNKKNKHTHT